MVVKCNVHMGGSKRQNNSWKLCKSRVTLKRYSRSIRYRGTWKVQHNWITIGNKTNEKNYHNKFWNRKPSKRPSFTVTTSKSRKILHSTKCPFWLDNELLENLLTHAAVSGPVNVQVYLSVSSISAITLMRIATPMDWAEAEAGSGDPNLTSANWSGRKLVPVSIIVENKIRGVLLSLFFTSILIFSSKLDTFISH